MFSLSAGRLSVPLALVLGMCLFIQPSSANENEAVLSSTAIKELIQELGSDSYATRMNARDKLQRVGLEAFDELHTAKTSLDYEIALAAKYLLGSLVTKWSKETDPPQVREALNEYGGQNEAERESRIKMLAELPDRVGLLALIRVVRFESILRLSRKAAITIMEQGIQAEEDARNANSKIISDGLSGVEREAAGWLRIYAMDLAVGKFSTDQWKALIRKQRDQIDSVSSAETSRPIVLSLVRVCAVHASAMGKRDVALQLAIDNADLVSQTTSDLIEASNWATDHGLHPFVVALQALSQPRFSQSAVLLYSHANALQVGGDKTESQRVADLAYGLNPLPRNKEAREKMQPKDLEDNAVAHRNIAMSLQERGLFQWSEREFLQIISALELDDTTSIVARSDLSRMYGDMLRHRDVVVVLKPLVERLEKDAEFKEKMSNTLGRLPLNWQSRIDYHTALMTLEESNEIADAGEREAKLDAARKKMLAAFLANQDDIDVLIRMYRTDGDAEWRALVVRLLEQATRTSAGKLRNVESFSKHNSSTTIMKGLAEALNNHAWLICNTEGDLNLALKSSLRSLEIVTDSAKLDTCGRCYFAIRDFDNAIRMQKRALELDPYSLPLKRQLVEFEAAKAKADQKD
ncbi:MAG: hypothetical protein OSA98_11330 [Rubripirellula sp.]|nr:hypothetical protein [Rubripirellula sp.]